MEEKLSGKQLLEKLCSIKHKVIWPHSEWEDIGFTERPIWVNAIGYGYFSCDDSGDFCFEGDSV